MPETEPLDWLGTCAKVQIQARASGSVSTAIFKKIASNEHAQI